MSDLGAALATLLAMGLYGALHSLLAGMRAKALARKCWGKTADRVYRLAYNFMGGLTFLPVIAIPARWPGESIYQVPWPWSAGLLGTQALAVALIVVALMQTGVSYFLGLRQLLQHPEASAPELEVRGLYRWVRHPLYFAGLVLIWLSPVMTTSSLALAIGLTAYIVLGSGFEERRLVAEFGQAYRDYQRRVPRLIPSLRRRPPGR